MGNTQPSSKCIVLVGLTETGKSHFLALVGQGELNSATYKPTHGLYEEVLVYGKKRIQMVEFGSLICSSWKVIYSQRQEHVAGVMWFIDSHDTAEDIYTARNRLLHMTGEHLPFLCIVHNTGRPRRKRRKCQVLPIVEWSEDCDDEDEGGFKGGFKGVDWSQLGKVVNFDMLERIYKSVYMTQLSYTDKTCPTLLAEWIFSHLQP